MEKVAEIYQETFKKCSLTWQSARVHALSLIRPIISVLSHHRNMVPIAAIDLAVILIPPSLVTVCDMK